MRIPGFGGDIYQLRGLQRNDLHRRNNASEPTGIYCCDIATIAAVNMRERVYVGLFTSKGGKLMVALPLVYHCNRSIQFC